VKNAVGPVLRMSDDIEAIIAAIEEDNPGTEIEVIDRGAYVRIQAERRMKVTRASIERHIGRTFEMRQLEPMMSAFAGRIETTSEPMTGASVSLQSISSCVRRSVRSCSGNWESWRTRTTINSPGCSCPTWPSTLSAALARYAISKRPENASVLRHWVQRWTPKADEAAAGLATMLSELPEIGREVDTTMTAAKAVRERVLSDAGVLAAIV
jgi:toluene monooxygenase system protein D